MNNSIRVTIRLTVAEHSRLVAAARADGLTVSAYIRSQLTIAPQRDGDIVSRREFNRHMFILSRLLFFVLENFTTREKIAHFHAQLIQTAKEKFSKEE